MLRSHGVGWGCKPSFDHIPSTLRKMLMLPSDVDATLTWGGVGTLTFPRPCSLDHTQDVDATLTWGGVGSDVNVPSATFPRPCARCWCYPQMLMLRSHGVGWGCKPSFDHIPSTLRKMLMLRSDVDATLTWGGVGWGGDVNVPSTTFPRPCARCWCYAHMGWGGDVNVPSTTLPGPCARCWCYAYMGWVGWGGGMLTFTRLCTRLWCCIRGVGWDGAMITLIRPCARCSCWAQDDPIIMLQGGVGWVLFAAVC